MLRDKPQALLRHVLTVSSRPGAVVLDCCMGGGSTGAACLETGRRFIGCDIDLTWVQYTAKRLGNVLAQPRLPLEPAPARREKAKQPALWEETC